jgi:hypothetical protein
MKSYFVDMQKHGEHGEHNIFHLVLALRDKSFNVLKFGSH